MVRKVVLLTLFITVLITFKAAATHAAEINVYADITPSSGSMDDEFIFSVTVEGTQEANYPEISPSEDFDVSLIGPEQSIEIINGKLNAKITYNYRLSPTKYGKLKTPTATVKVGGKIYAIKPLTVLVNKNSSSQNSGISDRIYLKQTVSAKEVFVGEQIVATVEVGARVPLNKYQLESASFDGFWHIPFGNREQTVKTVGGYRYKVFKEKTALFPVRSGNLKIPPRKATVVYIQRSRRRAPFPFSPDLFDDMFFGFGGRPVERTISSNELYINVKPLPPRPRNVYTWGSRDVLVGFTDISLKYSQDPIEFGKSKTLEVRLRSRGNLNPVKKVQVSNTGDVKIYHELPEEKITESGGMLLMEKTFRLSIVPKYGGTVKIAPLKLTFFDPLSKSYNLLETDPIEFEVIGGPTKKATASGSQNKIPSKPTLAPSEDQATYPPYKPETFLERLSSQISFSLAVLILACLALLGFFIYLIIARIKKIRPYKLARIKIESASNLDELNQSFLDYLSLILNVNCRSLSSEELKAHLRSKFNSGDILFAICSVLDQINALRYSPSSDADLTKLKEQIKKIESSICLP